MSAFFWNGPFFSSTSLLINSRIRYIVYKGLLAITGYADDGKIEMNVQKDHEYLIVMVPLNITYGSAFQKFILPEIAGVLKQKW